MLEELMAESSTFGSALDDAWNVGDDKAASRLQADHAQVRVQGCKGIVGHLRPCLRYGRDQGRLSGVRKPQQADIGKHLEFEMERARLAGRTFGELSRCTVDGGFEMDVALAAGAAPGHQQPLAGLRDVAYDFIGLDIAHDGAQRNAHYDVFGRFAGSLPPLAGLAVAGLEHSGMAKVDQRVETGVCFHPDAAAVAAVAAVGTALRNVLLAPEAHAAVPAAAGADFDSGFVDEFHGAGRLKVKICALFLEIAKSRHAAGFSESGCCSGLLRRFDRDELACRFPALAEQDIACIHLLPAVALHAEKLGIRIAAVAGRTACFFMCHLLSPRYR